MIGLLYKHFIFLRWITIIYGVMLFILTFVMDPRALAIWSNMMMMWCLSAESFANKSTRHGDTLINCLPVTRSEIVRSKYLAALISALIIFSICYVIDQFSRSIFQFTIPINYNSIILGFGIGIAVHIPINYYFGNLTTLSNILPSIITLIPTAIFLSFMQNTSLSVIAGTILISMLISYPLSLDIYRKKEF